MLHFWTVFILQAFALQRTDLPCEDQELSDQCSKECRENYISCFANCESTYCNSECLQVYQDCDSSCPCGIDCPGGCANCNDHELCQARCENAHENNDEYRLCFYDALFEHNLCLKECPASAACHELCFDIYSDKMATCPCMAIQTTSTTVAATTTTTTTTSTSTTTTTKTATTEVLTTQMTTMEQRDVFILVITKTINGSYLQSGDGSSQISATINAPDNYYAFDAAHALVNGELHIFGGHEGKKIARLDGCSLKKLPAVLNEERYMGHVAVSTENGQKALVCFGSFGDLLKSCDIFDGSSTVPTFSADWPHAYVSLGLYNHQPATVGCLDAPHQKAETLSATGWTALPDHPLKISSHSLVGLQNGAMLLLGGRDWGSYSVQSWTLQAGIWQLKDDQWSRIGEFSKPAGYGSAIYVSGSVYYFENGNSAIYRLDLDENEELEAVQEIGSQPGSYYCPVLFQTDNDYCT